MTGNGGNSSNSGGSWQSSIVWREGVIAENVCNIAPRNELGKGVKYFLRWLDTEIELGNYGYNIRNTEYPLQEPWEEIHASLASRSSQLLSC